MAANTASEMRIKERARAWRLGAHSLTKASVTAAERASSIVNASLLQSSDAPVRLLCDTQYGAHTRCLANGYAPTAR